MEWKETGHPGAGAADYRFNVFLKRSASHGSRIQWCARAEFGDYQGAPVNWQYVSTAPVPIGQWLFLEVFWNQHPTSGRLWFAINDDVIFNHRGRTQLDSPFFVYWPFKIYVGDDRLITQRGPLFQWIDDVRFYDNFPPPAWRRP
jgi:hypothetical protein